MYTETQVKRMYHTLQNKILDAEFDRDCARDKLKAQEEELTHLRMLKQTLQRRKNEYYIMRDLAVEAREMLSFAVEQVDPDLRKRIKQIL